jgi:hypothetical protein
MADSRSTNLKQLRVGGLRMPRENPGFAFRFTLLSFISEAQCDPSGNDAPIDRAAWSETPRTASRNTTYRTSLPNLIVGQWTDR